ncbi:transglycosylase domain-containing protein [Terrilactibacillus sp. S3-3]|nr:transglycosylase domain-containing protein [Terrilactibacillus sp. S3-3]
MKCPFKEKQKRFCLPCASSTFFTKNQILDAYLNIVPFGRNASGQNIAGAAAAAEGIFGVKPDKLNIPQAAYLAGLPKNPFVYSPFENHGGVKKDFSAGIGRAHTVLRRMYEAGYISHSDLEKYLKYDYRKHLAKAHSLIADDYPYVTDEVDSEAQTIMAKV